MQFRTAEPAPRFVTGALAGSDLLGAVAREVVEHYGDAIMGHPVGTGPFRLAQWRRSSFIVQGWRMVRSDVAQTFFNMEDPVVGGYTPDKVALRRAIFLAVDLQREINLVRRGQAIPAQSPVQPNTWAYDPKYKSENSEYSLPKAKALLDMYGYVDKDGDGWRDMPDGQPLLLKKATQPDQQMELPVKKLLLGAAPEQVLNRDAMANADSIGWFVQFAQRRAAAS